MAIHAAVTRLGVQGLLTRVRLLATREDSKSQGEHQRLKAERKAG